MEVSEKSVLTPRFDSFELQIITDVIKHGKVTQIYKGPVVKGCYHGRGLMIWIEENQKQMYEGYFYVNQIHGYGCMTYANGMVFEGLYKENIRFGPGVMTCPNQHQEVGFWIGARLLRLSCNLTTNTVPSYDLQNISTKMALLQFRHLIDLTEPPYSITNIRDNNEKYLNVNHSFPYSRHLNSLFFDAQAFDSELMPKLMISKTNTEVIIENNFISGHNMEDLKMKNNLNISQETSEKNEEFSLNCDTKINKICGLFDGYSWTNQEKQHDITSEPKNSEPSEKKSKKCLCDGTALENCSNILAYNNNTLDKMILTHAYQQRFGESILLYDVHNIWNGKRNMFMPSHDQELAALNLLSKLQLSLDSVQSIFKDSEIDSDIADSRGNTRLMISSANDQHEIIKCMIDLGANLECYNDDGFTPLNLTLMRYISMLNDIKSWTEYLIPQKGDQLLNTGKINFFQPENLSNMKFIEIINDYFEDDDANFKLKHTVQRKQMTLKSIEKTIMLLISLGAKATTCFTPKTSIHLALLTVNPIILQAVFNAGGPQSYVFSSDESSYTLNLLHIAVMMPTNPNMVKCIEVLITQKVDPNFKTLPFFSVFRYKLPWRKITTIKDYMTPLDIFCLKENHSKSNRKLDVDEQSESELVSILYNITKKSHSYCGLKPTALAMLTGKLHLTKMLLNENRKIVDETISGLGTLLTLLLNPTYNLNLTYKKIHELLDLLLNANSNPLKIVKIPSEKFRGNIFDYCYKLQESKKLDDDLSNFGGIIDKLKSVGKTILNVSYAIKAKSTLLKKIRDLTRNTYKNHRTTALAEDWMKMMLWLNFGFKTKYPVKAEKYTDSCSSIINAVKKNEYNNNFKENVKGDTYGLYLIKIKQKSLTRSPTNLTKEESQVCYECLKYSSLKMESCSSCYFALLCSESCKNQHTKHGCITKIKQRRIRTQLKLDKNDSLMNKIVNNKSYLSSTYSIEKPRLESMINSERITLESMSYLRRSTKSSTKRNSFLIKLSSSFSKNSNNLFSRKSSTSSLKKLSTSFLKEPNTKVSRTSSLFFETSSNLFAKNKNDSFSMIPSKSFSQKSITTVSRTSSSISEKSNTLFTKNKNNSFSRISSTLFSKKSSTSLLRKSNSPFSRISNSSFSRKSIVSYSDSMNNKINWSQQEILDKTREQKHINSDSEDGSYQFDSIKLHSSILLNNTNSSHINSKKNKKGSSSHVLFSGDSSAIYSDENKSFKNKSVNELKKSTKSRHVDKPNDMKTSRKHLEKQRQNRILNRQSNGFYVFSGKYKILRTPGCWRPMFMFINRGSCENAETLRGLIDTRMTYYILTAKDGRVFNEIKNDQYDMLYNYSLI